MVESNLRYTVGETYPFLLLKLQVGEFVSTRITYVPDDGKTSIIELKVINLLCKEHHRVPVHYRQSEEDKVDGFIFEDNEGKRWFNQYPTAHYGQLNDAMDWRVRSEDINPGERSPSNEPTTCLRDLRMYLETLERDLYLLNRNTDPEAKTVARSLLKHRNQIILEANSVTGKKVMIKQALIDDKPLDGFYDVTFE